MQEISGEKAKFAMVSGIYFRLPRFSSCQIDRRPFLPRMVGGGSTAIGAFVHCLDSKITEKCRNCGERDGRTCGVEAIRKGRKI
jgi:hypothetical protein